MKHQIGSTAVAGAVIVMICLVTPPTAEGKFFLLFLSAIAGSAFAYVSTRRSLDIFKLERIALLGTAIGIFGGVLCFVITTLFLMLSGAIHAVLNLSSAKLAVVGLVQLGVTSGLGALAVGIILRRMQHSAKAKEKAN